MNAKAHFLAARSLFRRGLNPQFRTPLVEQPRLTRSGRNNAPTVSSPDADMAWLVLRSNGLSRAYTALGRDWPSAPMVSHYRYLAQQPRNNAAIQLCYARQDVRRGGHLFPHLHPHLPKDLH